LPFILSSFYQFQISSFLSERWQKTGSFGFLRFGLWVGKNQMCLFARGPFQHEAQRLRLYAVRDCGLLSCPPTPKFKRGRMLE